MPEIQTNPKPSKRHAIRLMPIIVVFVAVIAVGGCTANKSSNLPVVSNPAPVTANNQWKPRIQAFDGVDMVLVPPGCFMMGSSEMQTDYYHNYDSLDEKPQIKVCYNQSFWIDKTPVSQEQFKQFNGVAAHRSYFTGAMLPVVQITWFEAINYCINNRGGWLPTEAEWEYAARGPDDLIYPWGNTFDPSKSVYWLNSDHAPIAVNRTDRIWPSWVGATDMTGNVWQWTSSINKPYPYYPNDGRESETDTNGWRTLRGGWWDVDDNGSRSAVRSSSDPGDQYSNVGFRCVHSF